MQLPVTLRVFWQNAPAEVSRALTILSAAVSLTDDIAYKLVSLTELSTFQVEEVVACLRASDFIIKPKGEWYIEAGTRSFLLDQLRLGQNMERAAHEILLYQAQHSYDSADRQVPKYLKLKVGEAYHTAALDQESGIRLYRESYKDEYTGEQWLLGELAYEQYRRKVLPAHVIEPFFFRAMTAYREGRWQDAEDNFLHVADKGEIRDEIVAVASHLLGLILQRQRHRHKEAQRYMERALRIEEQLEKQHGRAVVMHSLANLIGNREPGRARRLLEESSEILKTRDQHGYSEVLHSLGKHLMKRNPKRAAELLRTSLKLLEKLKDLHGQAQVLHTRAKLLRRSKPDQAVKDLRRSLELRQRLGIWREQAQVMQSIAEIVGNENPEEARRLLLEALEIEKEFNDKHGQAQVLNALGMNLRGDDWEGARTQFENVLSLSNHPKDLAIAHLGLSQVAEEYDHDLASAHSHMQEAIKYQRLTNRSDLVKKHQQRLQELERRMQAGH